MQTSAQGGEASGVAVRRMQSDDIPQTQRVFRLAFGTFFGAPDPEQFWEDHDFVSTRWRADPEAWLVAELQGAIVGSNFATNWGSFGFFGPLTVRPDLWEHKIAQKLLDPTMELFANRGMRETGLFTFAHSPKHISLYQKFGYWPRFLTALLSKNVTDSGVACIRYSACDAARQGEILHACRALTGAIFDGLDVSLEIRSVAAQQLGDTLLLWDRDALEGFAVCHAGAGTEAGANHCYIKFAAVRPGPGGEATLNRLLGACEAFAAARGLQRLMGGMNLARERAYRQMRQSGFRAEGMGVAMQKPNAPGFNREDVFVVDDWR
jgi:GNAT superfamily N-acetyltransferase